MGGGTRAALTGRAHAFARERFVPRSAVVNGQRGDSGMYTGIVEELGEVVGVERLADAARITVRGPLVTSDAGPGDSLAVNGVCLTVTSLGDGDGTFTADVMLETLTRSSLGELRPGSQVNLERPVRPDGRLGGHLVQGHVDGTGVVLS